MPTLVFVENVFNNTIHHPKPPHHPPNVLQNAEMPSEEVCVIQIAIGIIVSVDHVSPRPPQLHHNAHQSAEAQFKLETVTQVVMYTAQFVDSVYLRQPLPHHSAQLNVEMQSEVVTVTEAVMHTTLSVDAVYPKQPLLHHSARQNVEMQSVPVTVTPLVTNTTTSVVYACPAHHQLSLVDIFLHLRAAEASHPSLAIALHSSHAHSLLEREMEKFEALLPKSLHFLETEATKSLS